MSKFCLKCGSPLDEQSQFCAKCGARTQIVCTACGVINNAGDAKCVSCGALLTAAQQPIMQAVAAHTPAQPSGQQNIPYPQAPQNVPFNQATPQQPLQQQSNYQSGYPAAQPGQPQYAAQIPLTAARKKSKLGLILGISAGVLVIAAAIVVFLILPPGGSDPAVPAQIQLTPFPAELIVDPTNINVSCSYDSPEYIIPANYRSTDDIAFMQISTDQGSTDLLIEVEIPGFTQKFEQKITATRSETELRVHPPLLDGVAETLNSSKDAQINISVTDLGSGKIIIKDSKPVLLYSRYDMQWVGEDGTPYDENVLAWVTPEAEEVRELLRWSADACYELSSGQLDAIVGYQEAVSGWSHEDLTYVQAFCIMHTMADEFGVKYIMTPFSSTDSTLQRIATPSEVLNSAGGLCVETSVTMASALQAMNMHAVLILLPGHCQVAVETWSGSGDYYLIETTALTNAASAATEEDFNNVIYALTKDDWRQYLAQDGYTAIDCDWSEQLQILSIG
jgi:hypothetical protein